MKKLFSISFLTFTSLTILGQTGDSVKVLEEVYSYIYCYHYGEMIGLLDPSIKTQEDSLNNCLEVKVFKTETEGILYEKRFNLYGQLKEEGYIKVKWHERKFLGVKLKPKKTEMVEEPNWRFYDNNGNLISHRLTH